MRALQRIALWLLLGALLGFVLVLFCYPFYVGYASTSLWGEAGCTWAECAAATSKHLRKVQLVGGGLGALLVALAGELVLWRRKAKKKQKLKTENAT